MAAYGGGLGTGEVCGAVFGAVAVFGLQFSRGRDDEREDPRMWALIREFVARFRDEIGGGKLYCRDIAGVDWTDIPAVKAFYKSEKILACRELTGATARLLGEFMEREPFAAREREEKG
ncbi:MAG: putative redox-active protein (C_GCAxxG_C_C) [Syntrophaceae bacterium PtaB.Bin038]|nr:MAG: putative redox-active protein (C_GCAxxG_C_C) [Syntrophaceae bacterium PtaB.Bin038]